MSRCSPVGTHCYISVEYGRDETVGHVERLVLNFLQILVVCFMNYYFFYKLIVKFKEMKLNSHSDRLLESVNKAEIIVRKLMYYPGFSIT